MNTILKKFEGFSYGLLSSITFGLIPLFAVPIMASGMQFMSVLFYRFTLASVALAIILTLRKETLKIKKSDFPALLLLSFLYLISSVFLLWGYLFMPSGVATTIHFTYPIITTIMMMIFFHEKSTRLRIIAILAAVAGVFFISHTKEDTEFSWIGLGIVLLSGVGYAAYLVALGQLRNIHIRGLKLTFYVFLFSSLFLLLLMTSTNSFQPIQNGQTALNLIMLAIIPTIISNLSLIEAVKRIGSTKTSVLGAMEPLTAVSVSIFVFKDAFTLSIGIGIILIISAVTIIILEHKPRDKRK